MRNYCTLCVETFKTLNNLNPSFIGDISQLRLRNRQPRDKYKMNSEIPKTSQINFETNYLRTLGPEIGTEIKNRVL